MDINNDDFKIVNLMPDPPVGQSHNVQRLQTMIEACLGCADRGSVFEALERLRKEYEEYSE